VCRGKFSRRSGISRGEIKKVCLEQAEQSVTIKTHTRKIGFEVIRSMRRR
jgi:hypothetical protein